MEVPVHRALRPRIFAAAVATLLAACGGGDPEEEPASDAQPTATSDTQSTPTDDEERRKAPLSTASPWLSSAHVVVQIAKDVNIVQVLEALKAFYPSVVDRLGVRPIYLLQVSNTEAALTTLAQVNNNLQHPLYNRIVSAERNRQIWSPEHVPGGIRNSVSAIGERVSDYPVWGDTTLRLGAIHPYVRGAGVRVAVLDTGIHLEHKDFDGKLAKRHDNSLLGYDFVGRDPIPSEVPPFTDREYTAGDGLYWAWGHGTHVAGVIATVAPDARIMPVRVLNPAGTGTAWTVAKGVVWAIDPDNNPATDDGAAVLNLSLGTPTDSRLLQRVIEIAGCSNLSTTIKAFDHAGFTADRLRCYTYHQEAVILAGAGNTAYAQLYPANFPLKGLRSVTASTKERTLPDFASRAPGVDIAAPGAYITSSFPAVFPELGKRATMSGTSMATPWAAGTAALVISSMPSLRAHNEEVLKRITKSELTTSLCGTTIRQIDPVAAVTGVPPPGRCP